MRPRYITSTPNGNDFPSGKTTSYTYSKGFANPSLNHNLLTITDGRRNDTNDVTLPAGPYLVSVYSTATSREDPTFDRVVRQIRGGDALVFSYLRLMPFSQNQQAVLKVIENDRNGHVTESLFDVGNRLAGH